MAARSWKRDPPARRERILTTAARLFGEKGCASVSTAAIAAAAGVSEGIIYHYYASKDGLLRAVTERYGSGFAEAMFDGLDADAGVPDVEAVIGRAFAYVRYRDPSFGVFLLSDDPADSTPPHRGHRTVIVSRLAGLFTAWQTRGGIRDADPRILAELCFGLVETALRECYARGRAVTHATEELYIAEVVRCIRALLSRS